MGVTINGLSARAVHQMQRTDPVWRPNAMHVEGLAASDALDIYRRLRRRGVPAPEARSTVYRLLFSASLYTSQARFVDGQPEVIA